MVAQSNLEPAQPVRVMEDAPDDEMMESVCREVWNHWQSLEASLERRERSRPPTSRFVSFLDILGFSSMVESKPLEEVIYIIEFALKSASLARSGGVWPAGIDAAGLDLKARTSSLRLFSFSDTFVLATSDDSISSFFEIIAGTATLAKFLFSGGCPVRGAISCGEADCVEGTAHLVGKAVVRAARLEKWQEWFGVLIDPGIWTNARHSLMSLPFLSPLIVEYEVPMKDAQTLTCKVINWRLNMHVQRGIASLFPASRSIGDEQKQQNTLKFCSSLRERGLAYQKVDSPLARGFSFPWLERLDVGENEPGSAESQHGDKY